MTLARSTREAIRSPAPGSYPHDRVLTRLAPSPIHGIGVFALGRIGAGTQVFATDIREIVWVDAAIVDALPAASAERRWYDDFAIRQPTRYGCPPSFDLLGTGWYVNEPPPGEAANIRVDPDFAMFAARDISAGEELTVAYASFSGIVAGTVPGGQVAGVKETAAS